MTMPLLHAPGRRPRADMLIALAVIALAVAALALTEPRGSVGADDVD